MIRFYALLSRMKYIARWGLMRNSRTENLSEHSAEVAMLAHALAAIGARRLGKSTDVGGAVLRALYHDCGEILTGDLPTPIKYQNARIRDAYKQVEWAAGERLLELLPPDLRPEYAPFLGGEEDGETARLVRAADKLSALIKCTEEAAAGNREFEPARRAALDALERMDMEEVRIFMAECLPAYGLALDDLQWDAGPERKKEPIG